MHDRAVTFRRTSEEHDWRSEDADIALCASGFADYVSVPENVHEFVAVFTEEIPAGRDHFELIRTDTGHYTLRSEAGMAWYDNVRDFIETVHDEGYRYVNVQY